MAKKSLILALFVLAAVLLAAFLRRAKPELHDIALKDIPGISPEVLNEQGKSVRIDDPVSCMPQKGLYWFNVEVLPSARFAEPESYEFDGDVERLRHFVHEIGFDNEMHNAAGANVTGFATGATDDVEGLVKSLLGLVFHPVNAVKAGWAGGGAALSYLHGMYDGKKDAVADLKAFAAGYVENARMKKAAEFGLNYEELQTPQAQADIAGIARANMYGAGTVEVALLLIPWAKAGDAAKAAEAAGAAGKVAEASDAAEASEGLTTVGKAASVFETAADAENGAARVAEFAEAARGMTNLERLANLLDPLKIATLNGSRALNSRLHKVLYWLWQEELEGHDPNEALWRAMKMAKADEGGLPSMLNGRIDHAQIINNYDFAKNLHVFERPENLELMRRGKSPLIDTPWGVENVEVDHIVPVSSAPELSNAWGNLAYQTKKFNRMRGDKFIPSMGEKLIEYRDAGILPQSRVDQILSKNVSVSTAER
jgi:hypothetical protein